MILSASRRTDIPCCYAQWMINRLREGSVCVRNPYRRTQVSRIPLSPHVIDCIVFWTKDPAPLLPYLDEMEAMGYRFYFQFTLTPYGKDVEQNLRDKAEIVKTFHFLAAKIGRERIKWRYDPIILNGSFDLDYHKTQFESLCQQLASDTESVTISFVDWYNRHQGRNLRVVTYEEMAELSSYIAEIARRFGIAASACCEQTDFTSFGVKRASCISKETVEQLCGCPIPARRDKNQRKGCGCVESVDIGAYQTCLNGCTYCYANHGIPAAAVLRHDPCSPLLVGNLEPNDVVTRREVHSLLQEQTTLF